jgi:hypothetical protein
MAKANSTTKRMPRAAKQRRPGIRITRDVPKLTISTLNLTLTPPIPPLRHRLLGPPLSRFAFSPEERAHILTVAPSMPETDWHRIPIIDVKLAYFVEDHIERIKEFSHRTNIKAASRELGTIANPNKGRRRDPARLSEIVVHVLAGQLLLRAGEVDLRRHTIDPMIARIRAGSIPERDLQRAARAARCLGALQGRRRWRTGTTCNEPFRLLASHVLNEWRFGMGFAIARLSQDPARDDGEHHGVHSELVRLCHALHAIAIRRLWQDERFMERTKADPPVIMERTQVYASLWRVRRVMEENDPDDMERGYTVLRPVEPNSAAVIERAERNFSNLIQEVLRARRAAYR